MTLLDRQLPEPQFVATDAEEITREMIAQYEGLVGRTLYPAQLERCLIDVIAYREKLVREAIQDAALLNLVRYSRGVALDCLGENVGVARVGAARAVARVKITLKAPAASDTVVSAGVRILIGTHTFVTDTALTVPANAAEITVSALAVQAGAAANHLAAGSPCTLLDAIGALDVDTATLAAPTEGGAEEESDARLRERIVTAPETFSVAGSRQAYWFHAMSAHPDIVDVAVFSHTPGVVSLYPMLKDGLPTQAVKDAVERHVSGEAVRPLTDRVEVLDPQPVDYCLDVQIILRRDADSALAQSLLEEAAVRFVSERIRFGRDIVVSQIIDALHVYGVHSVVVTEPAADVVVDAWAWPRCVSSQVTITGVADE